MDFTYSDQELKKYFGEFYISAFQMRQQSDYV